MNSQLKRELELYESLIDSIGNTTRVSLKVLLEKISKRLNKNKSIKWRCGMGIESFEIFNTNVVVSTHETLGDIYKERIYIRNGTYVQDSNLNPRVINRFPEMEEFYDIISAVEDVVGRDKIDYGWVEIRGKKG